MITGKLILLQALRDRKDASAVRVKDAIVHCVLSNEIVGYTDFISYVWLYDAALLPIVHRPSVYTRMRHSASSKVPFQTAKEVVLFLENNPKYASGSYAKMNSPCVYRPL